MLLALPFMVPAAIRRQPFVAKKIKRSLFDRLRDFFYCSDLNPENSLAAITAPMPAAFAEARIRPFTALIPNLSGLEILSDISIRLRLFKLNRALSGDYWIIADRAMVNVARRDLRRLALNAIRSNSYLDLRFVIYMASRLRYSAMTSIPPHLRDELFRITNLLRKVKKDRF